MAGRFEPPRQCTIGVRVDNNSLKAMLSFQLPEFKTAANLARQWNNAGYYGSEPKPDAVAREPASRNVRLIPG